MTVRPSRRSARRFAAALAFLWLATAPASARPVQYQLDPVHTRVVFAVSHAGFSQAIGTVSGSTGVLVFDPDDWPSARVEVSVPLARADLGDDAWNRAALAANLLDAKAHPLATFVSTRIEPIDARHASVHGTLTLHGVARGVTLDVTLNAARRHPMPPFRRTAGFSATTTISRKAFGIAAWPSMIGDDVAIRIEAEATRARGGIDAPEKDADEASDDIAADIPASATDAAAAADATNDDTPTLPPAPAPDSTEPEPTP